MTRRLLGCLAGAVILAMSQQAAATLYTEVGDAGYDLATAQLVPGGTTGISGGLGTGDPVDIYRFSWGGGTIQVDTQGSANFDSMLFIYNLTGGAPLAFNDDYPSCCQSLISANLATGDYLVAIDNFSLNYNGPLSGFPSSGDGVGQYTINISTTAGNNVPEPATLALVGLGFAGLGFSRRKQA